MSEGYQKINAESVDRWCAEGWEWGEPITHETFKKAERGEWGVYLTPTKYVPHEWFGELKDKSRFLFSPLWEQSVLSWITLIHSVKASEWWQRERDTR